MQMVLRKMKKKPNQYKKNIKHIETIFDEINK